MNAGLTVAKRSARLACPDGLQMGLDIFLSDEGRPLPITVVCHGFKGFKDWGLFPPLAGRLASSGRAVAVFDFSHNGVGEQPGEFTRLDLFKAQTLSRHVADLRRVLDFLDTDEFAAACNLQRNHHVSVVGHSMGGAVAVLAAADDARIVQVTTLNGLAILDRFSPADLDEMERTGQVLIRNERTGQDMPLGSGWLQDARRLDMEAAARRVSVPALVITGAADQRVPPSEARQINAWIAGSRLVTVPGADHVFNCRHPFAGWTSQLETVARELDAFLPSARRPVVL